MMKIIAIGRLSGNIISIYKYYINYLVCFKALVLIIIIISIYRHYIN